MLSDSEYEFEKARISRLAQAVMDSKVKEFTARLKWDNAQKRAMNKEAFDSYERQHAALMAIAEEFERFRTALIAIRRKWRPEPGARDFAL